MKGVSQNGHLIAESAETAWLQAQEKARIAPGSLIAPPESDSFNAFFGLFFWSLQNICRAARALLSPFSVVSSGAPPGREGLPSASAVCAGLEVLLSLRGDPPAPAGLRESKGDPSILSREGLVARREGGPVVWEEAGDEGDEVGGGEVVVVGGPGKREAMLNFGGAGDVVGGVVVAVDVVVVLSGREEDEGVKLPFTSCSRDPRMDDPGSPDPGAAFACPPPPTVPSFDPCGDLGPAVDSAVPKNLGLPTHCWM